MSDPFLRYIGCANALEIDQDGWALIPYGDSRHSGVDPRLDSANAKAKGPQGGKPIIQRFDREAAIALVNQFKSVSSSIKRAVVGLPIFKGHPDSKLFEKIHTDKTPRGAIADMEVGEKGLRFRPVLTRQGAEDVHEGWDEFSPYWLLNKCGEENGATIARPFLLNSIGIVPRGNIPGLSLVNAADPEDSSPDATDETIASAVDSACPAIAAANAAEAQLPTLTTEKKALADKLATAEAEKARLEGEKIALANAKDVSEKAFKAERQERSMLLVNAAVVDGRVPAAERDAAVLALVNAADFPAEVTKLAARTKALATESRTRVLGAGRSTDGGVVALVNARMKEHGETYDAAYAAVQSDPKHAAVFKAMKTPEIKFPRRR
jgi:hypothetical protein